MDITFCTFFFDIDRQNWKTFGVHNNTYLFWFKNLLSLDINLHIETEEKFVEFIREKRRLIDPEMKKTIIEVKKVEDLDAYREYNDRLIKLMNSDSFKMKVHHGHVPEMSKPLYNVLMFNKVYTLKNVIEKNPFNTEYFSWVDAGFIRDESVILGNTDWPDFERMGLTEDKIRFFCINDNVVEALTNVEYHCLSQTRCLKGTIFFMHKSCIEFLKTTFDTVVTNCIDSGFIGSDEKMFDLCYKHRSEKFDLVRCGWREEFGLYVRRKKVDYDFDFTWNTDDVDRVDGYEFWYMGVEDSTTKVLYRYDFTPEKDPDVTNFSKYSVNLKFSSYTKPVKVVMWPVDKTGKWLKRIVYDLNIV